MEAMQEVRRKLAQLGYPRAGSPPENMLYPGDERYNLLEWLFQRLLGPKSPFATQSSEETKAKDASARVRGLAEMARFLYITNTVDLEAMQGVGSYESRVSFVSKIVDLVEASQPEEGAGWSLDQHVAKYCQLLDILSERLPEVLSKDCVLFSQEDAAQLHPYSVSSSLPPIPSVDKLEEACRERSEHLANLQSKLGEAARTYKGTEDPRDANRELHERLATFIRVAEEFKVVYDKEIRPWENSVERPKLEGIGPAANRLLTSYLAFSQLLTNVKRLHVNTESCSSSEPLQSADQGPGSAHTTASHLPEKFVEALADVDRALEILSTSNAAALGSKQREIQ